MLILRWLAEQALRGKELLSFAFVVAFSLWVSSAPEQAQKRLKCGLAGSVLFPLQSTVDAVRVRVGLEQELQAMRRENARLVTQNLKLVGLVGIERQLMEFEAVRPGLEYPVAGARVISRDPLRLGGTWILDKGSEVGIHEGMAVATASGLAGRIISSSNGFSLMQSLADPDCRVAVLSTRSRNPGILHSTDGTGVFVEFSVTSDIREGDSLVTWGAGGIFPKGIPVGIVRRIRRTPANVLRNAEVSPSQNPWDVSDVFVLLRPPQFRVLPDSVLDQIGRPWK